MASEVPYSSGWAQVRGSDVPAHTTTSRTTTGPSAAPAHGHSDVPSAQVLSGNPEFATDINVLFQQAVLDSAERQLGSMADELQDKHAELGEIQQSREDMAIALAQQAKVARANVVALEAAKKRVDELDSEVKVERMKVRATEGELKAEQAARAQLKGELEKVQAQLKRAGVQINELQVRCRLLSPAPAVCAHMPRCPLPRRRRHPPWRTMRPCKSASLSALLRKLCKTRMQPPKQRSCPRTW